MTHLTPYDNAIHRQGVIELWKATFSYGTPHNEPPLVIDKMLEVAGNFFFVALDNTETEVIGTILAGYDGHRGWLYSVAVKATHRASGIGTALVRRAEEALIERGCMKINLQIVGGNEAVTPFYESLGYVVEPRVSMGKRIPANVPTA
ncbi:GNAT family acetyltransferase [Variovorax sp. J22R133]|uniref:GNAT family acetyltransferase n=1 Tax=Variovorax brevis TaxID=3053503 RepID=UPI002577E836|nr:GNAT family acetyltransferase [Variovorax sp. J22R133]MDM0112061.1 GNAT family acetyltransferase [Variovorax sp. J22R133]